MTTQEQARASTSGQVLRATLIGTVVEWYDYSIYGFLGVIIAAEYFPSADPTAALLSAYLSYAVAYAVRPIAGAVIGHLADRFGRKDVLAWTILLMGCATFLIGLVPGHASIGVAAPILIVLLRLLQGIGASGEWSIGATYLLESSPRSRWSMLAAYLAMAYLTALIIGAGLAATLAALLGDAFTAWGWRILFLLAAPVAVVGQHIRKRLDESPEFQRMAREREANAVPQLSLTEALRRHWRPLVGYIGVMAQQRVAQFALATFVVAALIGSGLSFSAAMLLTALTYLVSLPMALLFGWVGQRHGSLVPVAISCLVITLSVVPTFMVIEHGRFWPIMLIQVVYSFGVMGGMVPATSLLIELFPPEVRGVASALSYNLATVVFGSTAPVVGTWLSQVSGADRVFAWYIAGLAVLVVPSLVLCRTVLAGRSQSEVGGAVAASVTS